MEPDPHSQTKVSIPFRGEYSYRTFPVFAAGVGMVLVFGPVNFHFLRLLFLRPPSGPAIWVAGCFVTVLSILFLCGCRLVAAYLRRRCLKLEITYEQIAYDGEVYPWTQIRWFYAVPYREWKYQMAVRSRGFSAIRHLTIDGGISHEDYQKLVTLLRARLDGRYPGLSIG